MEVLAVILHSFARYLVAHLELEVFIEATASGAGPRIRRRLPLSFNTLNDLSRLGVDPAKRINTRLRVHDCVISLAVTTYLALTVRHVLGVGAARCNVG